MRNLLFSVAACLSTVCFSQKHDYVWIIGDSNTPNITTQGGMTIDFRQKPVIAKFHYRPMDMFVCNVSICDTAGNLLFYSNGCDIAGADDTILPNGDNVNPGLAHQIACVQNGDGYPSNHQSAVILPLHDNDGIYYIFHKSLSIVFNPTVVTTDKLLYSIVDMKANGGTGQVVEKNIPVIFDSLAYGEMNAVKHANGKDWWIITPKESSNQFYIFLFTNDGIVDTLTQTIGDIPLPINEGYGQTTFSPLGDKMIRYYPTNKVWLYDFDRSSGVFTGYSTIGLNTGTSIAFDGGCAISPNGRFLYIAALTNIYQFDLTASNISSTQTTVATWDGFVDPIAVTFWHSQLGPDCKIYIVGGGDLRYYHIIHNPDEPGLACNVEQRGMVLPTPCGASIPYFPNYRLGPIDNPGLPCSPVVATSQPVPLVRNGLSIFPNPANDAITIQYNLKNKETSVLQFFNVFGQLAKEIMLMDAKGSLTVPTGNLATGVYIYTLDGVASGRLVINR